MSDLFDEIDRRYDGTALSRLICLFLTMFVLWACLMKIHEQVHGIGKVIPSGKLRSVQHLEGGILKAIYIEEGQSIEKGDVLFELDDIEAQSSRQELQISIDSLYIKMARLKAEREGQLSIDGLPNLEKQYPQVFQTELQILESRSHEFLSKKTGLEERARQKELLLETLKSRLKNLRQESDISKKQMGINKKLNELGAVSDSRYLQSESTVRDFNTRIKDVENQIPITIAELQEENQALNELLQKRQSDLSQEVNSAEVEILKLKERLENFKDRMMRTKIVSPVRGIIKTRYVDTIGGVIKHGDTLVDILPSDEELIVEAEIATNDRAKIYSGMPVEAVLTAYDYATYGGISGRLSEISADSYVDQKGREYYKVKAILSDQSKRQLTIYSGMTVDLKIQAGRVSIMHAILRPLLKIQNRALREK